ncbi:condensation domain-containing protein [Microbispora triticiradicis]|uniref:condensation domain-containing protein n=1 Tax=Microbispora triticiradicis TaxID=2200763 RepID=UPI001AD7480B|nr:condensation domain-containing protein [Microbispora triticiradicis]MBO4272412.1 non-ribosomal peptide synthetase/polyketide synthase [Microbispora triticiradicis]
MTSSSYVGAVGSGPERDYGNMIILPAAPSQRQLWFLCQWDPAANAAYNVTSAVRLTGRLDPVLLQRALNQVVARHESLRAGVGVVDGDPRQVVAVETLVALPTVDCSHLSPEAAEEYVQRAAEEQASLPFVLDEPPLLRVLLVREAADRHTLIVVIHHICCDGWSIEVFYRDLAESYRRLLDGEGPPPELPIQYADYVAWREESLAGEPLRDLVAHWCGTLSGVQPLPLPVDHSRQAQRRMAAARLEETLPADEAAALDALGRGWEATPFMLLLAAFAVTLARVTGQPDVAVGTPVAGRHHPDAEDVIGFFANPLVLRTRLPEGAGFADAVRAVRNTCLEAFSHQEMPFDRLVEELRLPRVVDRNPLFDVMFSMQNTPGVLARLPELTMVPVDVAVTSAKFDLWLTVLPDGDGLRLRLDYDRDLYDPGTARLLLDVYRAVLAEIRRDPGVRWGALPRADAGERALAERRSREEAPAPPDGTILDMLADRSSSRNHGVRAADAEVSHADLRTAAAGLAARLRAEGVGPGVVVATPPLPSAALLVAALAVFETGAVLTYGSRHPRAGAFVTFTADDWLVTTGPRFDPVPSGSPGAGSPAWQVDDGDRDGHTVVFSHRALAAAATAVAARLGLGPDDEVVLVHDGGPVDLVALLAPLSAGARLVLTDTPAGGTVVVAAPQVWRRLLTEGYAPSPDARLVCVGPFVADDLAEALGRTGNTVFLGRRTPLSAAPVSLSRLGEGSGPPLAGTVRRLLDETGEPVPPGVVGELWLSGPAVVGPATAGSGTVGSGAAGSGAVATGERYRCTPSGELRFAGYADGRLTLGDHVVRPDRIERRLTEVEGVREAAVVPGETGAGPRLVGWVVPADPQAAASPRSREALVATVREALANARDRVRTGSEEPGTPAAFGVLRELPRLPDGGVDRAALTAMCGEALREGIDETPPRNRLERAIISIFRDVLPVPEFGVHADFFALGGHSVLAAKVIGRVRDQLGVLVPVRDFFRRATVAGLAEAVAAVEEERARAAADASSAAYGGLAELSDAEIDQLLRRLG